MIYATSNRRHLVRECFSDRDGDEIHRGDTIQESLSLSDRFGLSVNFSVPDKTRYLDIVHALAEERGLEVSGSQLDTGAEQWALAPGRPLPPLREAVYRYGGIPLKTGIAPLNRKENCQ